MESKLEKFVDLTSKLTGKKAPLIFKKGECIITKKWDTTHQMFCNLKNFFSNSTFELKRKEFNQIMLVFGCEPVGKEFFQMVFGDSITSIDEYEKSVTQFRILSMRKFGNFKYAFQYFTGIRLPNAENSVGIEDKPSEVWNKLNKPEDELRKRYKSRAVQPLKLKEIALLKRHFVSEIHRVKKGEPNFDESEKISKDAKYNSALYLTNDYIDVYVATSMRTKKQFGDIAKKIEEIFLSNKLKELNLRYFDPTISDAESRLEKGLIEALMLRRAKVTLYLAQESDSLGKDSELATTLAQGKDVVVMVPSINHESRTNDLKSLKSQNNLDELEYIRTIASKFISPSKPERELALKVINAENWDGIKEDIIPRIVTLEKKFYDTRAELIKKKHPLGLQVNLNTGVANGVIVVRNTDEAVNMIYASLTNSHKYSIEDTPSESLLKEVSTGSIVRVVSNDKFLTKTFWSNYIDFKRHE